MWEAIANVSELIWETQWKSKSSIISSAGKLQVMAAVHRFKRFWKHCYAWDGPECRIYLPQPRCRQRWSPLAFPHEVKKRWHVVIKSWI